MTLKAPAASAAHCWAVKIVNWPAENDDARIEFMIPYGSTQAKVLARGRVEASQWRLTSVESQPAFCGWFVDGPLAGYQQVGNCHCWKHFLSGSSGAFRNRDFPWRLMP